MFQSGKAERTKGKYTPAIAKVCSHFFQVGIAHVLDGENKAGLILVDGFPDIVEKTLIVFPARLLSSLCQ